MEQIRSIPLKQLFLDKMNPRIHQSISSDITQINLARFIYDNFGIKDIKDSILKNGYFPVEPMVVIPDDGENYIVVEGNRRLTTIKILCEDDYRNVAISLGKREDYMATLELKERLKEIPVVIAKNRESVNAYLGVRHLGGVVRWEPLAQSKYVYNQIIVEKIKTPKRLVGDLIDDFVLNTNNSKTDVINHFYKFCIYKYMQKLIDEDKNIKASLESKFSLLEVAFGKAGRSSVAKYIGIESYSRLNPEDYENIIPDDKEVATKNLIKWVFSENPPIKESRQINEYLKPILSKVESTVAFEQGEDKEVALLLSETFDVIVENSCTSIHKHLTHIQNNWAKTKPDSRSDLKKLYEINVVEKVSATNRTVDLN